MSIGARGEKTSVELADPNDGRQELTEHLSELRIRLIRSAIYIVVGMIVMYAVFPWLFKLLSEPITDALREIAARRPPDQQAFAGAYVFRSFYEPFFLRLQLSLVAGIVVAAPCITLEVWGFVVPALTSKERRSVRYVAPFSVGLFVMGATLAFFIMPMAIHWFLLYLWDFPGAVLLQDPQDYILFLVKMILAFGLVFQLPVMMMGLGRFGIIRSRMLTKYWRHSVVAISVAAMIITPSNDPFSMLMMTIPLVVLFFVSIWLVKIVEPKSI
jgi:sec-independent protein translocase protein TatC